MSVVVVGGGAFGTAVACVLARAVQDIFIVVRDAEQACSINESRKNLKYLPDFKLPRKLKATTDISVVKSAGIVLLATPAKSIESICRLMAGNIPERAVVINLAKGLSESFFTLDKLIAELLPGNVVGALKGPNFARPLLQGAPSGMTLALSDVSRFSDVEKYFKNTVINLEHWHDVSAIEFISALKNVLAIVMGICDATEDNPNTRFMVIQHIVHEANVILKSFGFDSQVLFTYAGIGDLLMTSLNDASRNRTLGLLIGRGFGFNGVTGPVLEGRRTVRMINQRLRESADPNYLLSKLEEVLDEKLSPQLFFKIITQGASKMRGVLC